MYLESIIALATVLSNQTIALIGSNLTAANESATLLSNLMPGRHQESCPEHLNEYCKNGGTCFVKVVFGAESASCICAPSFVGKQCSYHDSVFGIGPVSSFISKGSIPSIVAAVTAILIVAAVVVMVIYVYRKKNKVASTREPAPMVFVAGDDHLARSSYSNPSAEYRNSIKSLETKETEIAHSQNRFNVAFSQTSDFQYVQLPESASQERLSDLEHAATNL